MGTFKGKKLALVLLLAAAVAALSLMIPSFRAPVFAVLRFPLQVLTAMKNEAGGMIFYHRNMVQNRRLAVEADLLRRKLADAKELELENIRLTGLLNLKQNSPYKVISARVIGRCPSSWSSSLIIDKGSAQGIRKGYVCVSFYGLIGRVVEVYSSSSTVMLLNDPSLCVSCLSQRSRQEGLICGSLSGTLLMKYLSKESDVKPDDTIITSGLTDVFPKGIVVGTVTQIREDMSGVNRYAVVKPAVDLSAVEELLVIIP